MNNPRPKKSVKAFEDVPFFGQRSITLDESEGQIRFVNCLWPKSFLAFGCHKDISVSLDDVDAVQEVGRGQFLRLYLDTAQGRCVVAPTWQGFDKLRFELFRIFPNHVGAAGGWGPYITMVAFMVTVFAIVGIIIYMLL
ncbi:MAG: hypothetical protein KDA66_04485 [Planctomycetaceae bacterium]|nr:hypothetical protein [Planctomycetaceae bacterium]